MSLLGTVSALAGLGRMAALPGVGGVVDVGGGEEPQAPRATPVDVTSRARKSARRMAGRLAPRHSGRKSLSQARAIEYTNCVRFVACAGLVATLGLGTLWASRASAATYVRAPYVQDLASRRASILLELDTPHAVHLDVVRGGDAGANNVFKAESAKDTSHELAVSGLEPATTYNWTLSVDDGTAERGTFTTAPEDDRPFRFIVYGDNRTNPYAHQTLVEAMRKTPGDFLVNTGDMVYDGSQQAEWTSFFAIERNLLRERCLFPTIGNHEIAVPTSDGALRYARMFRVPSPPDAAERWYTFRWGSARFFMLDAQDDFSTVERAWLEKSLSEADGEQGLQWRFVVLHHGPWSAGLHGGNQSMIIGRVPELLKQHKVDVIFAGHDHDYERGEEAGLRYIVSGGGGAPLYREFRGDKHTQRFEPVYHFLAIELGKALQLTAIRLDGSIIERCSLSSGGNASWACGAAPAASAAGGAVTAAGGPSTSAAPAPASEPPTPPRRACGCSIVGSGSEWLGLLVAGGLSSAVALRRRRKPSPNPSSDARRRGMMDDE